MRSRRVDFLLYGKINRAEFAFFFCSSILAFMLAFAFEFPPIMTDLDWAVALSMLGLLFIVQIFLALMRCRDIGRSGWFLLIWFIPYIGMLWVLGELLFRRSKNSVRQAAI